MVVGAANPMWHNRGRGGAKYFRPGPSVWTPVDNVDNGVVSVKIGNRKYKKDLYLGKVILIQKILILQLLHGFKLFHLVSDFQNRFCF